MNITCPACGFAREVDESKLPPTASVATCPRCRERFRFRDPADAPKSQPEGEADPSASQATEAAGPPAEAANENGLPPGAVVPPRMRGPEDEDLFSHPRDGRSARKAEPPRRERGDADEDDEEMRRQAAQAYRRAAELPPLKEGEALDNPWENPVDGYLAAFYQTVVRVLFAAPRFFAGLRPQPRLTRPFVFAVAVGLVQITAWRIWLSVFAGILAPHMADDPQASQLITMFTTEVSIPYLVLLHLAMVSMELVLAACLYYMMFRLVIQDKVNFSLLFQIAAYSSAPAVLGIVPLLGSLIGFFWAIGCSFIGCRYALRITWLQTLMALGPLYFIVFPLLLQLLAGVSKG